MLNKIIKEFNTLVKFMSNLELEDRLEDSFQAT